MFLLFIHINFIRILSKHHFQCCNSESPSIFLTAQMNGEPFVTPYIVPSSWKKMLPSNLETDSNCPAIAKDYVWDSVRCLEQVFIRPLDKHDKAAFHGDWQGTEHKSIHKITIAAITIKASSAIFSRARFKMPASRWPVTKFVTRRNLFIRSCVQGRALPNHASVTERL